VTTSPTGVPRVISGVRGLLDAVGTELGVSEWITVDQALINSFADVTGDDYWGHVDPVRARESELGVTIAHGLLTLSLHPRVLYSLVEFEGFKQMFHYGYDRVRFPAALPVDARVRVIATLTDAVETPEGVRASIRFVFESESADKPVCVADYVQFFRT
jgi:acyl dehydratase